MQNCRNNYPRKGVRVTYPDSRTGHYHRCIGVGVQYRHKKLHVVYYLDEYEVACCDEDVVTFLDEGVLA